MSGGTVAASVASIGVLGTAGAVAGVAASTASLGEGIANAVGGSSGGSGSNAVSGGQNISQQQYSYYGPHPSTTPLSGQQAPKPDVMAAPKGVKAQVATAGETPTKAVGTQQADSDYNNVWASRLSHYLDYNTRSLG